MRDDGAFQRHDRPAVGQRLGDRLGDVDEGAGGFWRHGVSPLGIAASCGSGTRASASANARVGIVGTAALGCRSVSTAAAMPSRSACPQRQAVHHRGNRHAGQRIAGTRSRRPSICGVGGVSVNLPSGSKPVNALHARRDDAAGQPQLPELAGQFAGAGLRPSPDRRAASRRVHEQAGDAGSTPANRTALAGDIAIANSGLPAASAAKPFERGRRQIGVAQDRVGRGDLVASLGAARAAWRRRSRKAPCRPARRSPRRRDRCSAV